MAEYSRLAKGSFSSTGAAKVIYLPFAPDYIEMINATAANTAPTDANVPFAWWDSSMGQGFAVEQVYNGSPAALAADTVLTNGFSTFSAGLSLQFGPVVLVSGIVKGTSVVTTSSNHNLSTGDVVVFENLYQSSSTGMPQISGMLFVVTVVTPTTFSINWNLNQSNYTSISGGGLNTAAQMQKVLYPFLYAPGVSFVENITQANPAVVTTTAPHNFVVGQEIAFRIPPQWGMTQINSLPDSQIPGSPLYYYVTVVNSSTQFTCSANSSSFTAFNSNPTVASVPGLSFPQVLAVGDVNSGGVAYSGGALYPSPVINGVSTINGPAISGAFVNNTRQGFVIGAGAGVLQTGSVLVGASGNKIYWRALLHDYSNELVSGIP